LCEQVPEQVDAYLGVFAQARSVAEIGFNGGHSTLTMLTANPGMEVQSFDLGVHEYSKPALEILKQMYANTGAQIDVEWGKSAETVPAFHVRNPTKKYDIVIVDGDHSFESCHKDTLNMRALAKPGSMLIIDDTPCKEGYCVDTCVEALTKAGVIKLLKAYPLGSRAFSLFWYTEESSTPSGSEVRSAGNAGHQDGDMLVKVPTANSLNATLKALFESNRAKLDGALQAKGLVTTEGFSSQVLTHHTTPCNSTFGPCFSCDDDCCHVCMYVCTYVCMCL
jgi:hypothetical protein